MVKLMQRLGQGTVFGTPGIPSDGEMPTATASCACDPDPFDGDLIKCRGFVLQCRLVFVQRARLFPSDTTKINYIIGLLRGRAQAWAQANAGAQLDSLPLEEFISRLERVFDRANHAGCAGDRLFTLRQGRRSVADYAVEFGTLAAKSGWNELAAIRSYDTVCDALVSGARPRDLSEMIDRAIELDNYQRERARSPPPRPRLSQHHEQLPTPPVGAHFCSEEPMQLGRTRLSSAERCRRFASDACLYWQTGHLSPARCAQKTGLASRSRRAGKRCLRLPFVVAPGSAGNAPLWRFFASGPPDG